jgi:Bardet-Biedl syndrome 4 protein
MAESTLVASAIRDRRNWLIHALYVRQEFADCLALIEEQLRECQGLCEYALFVKGLMKRTSGELQESLALFQAATMISPFNAANLKQVGRSLFLLGKHKAAIEVYEEAEKRDEDATDWELPHQIGACYAHLKQFEQAEECFRKANVIQRHDCTFLQLGKLLTLQDKFEAAIEVYLEALEFSPENAEILTTIGLLYLRVGNSFKSFDYLGNSLTLDPRDSRTILAAGSMIQDHQDFDVALSKYRVAAVHSPNSAQLWNNIGMCFFGKKHYIAAISSLRRALSLAPFEWIIAYNLGLVFLSTGQYASAFHFLSASINLKPDFASTYAYLAVCLARIDDFENACNAYEKALAMEQDHIFELNYSITLFNKGDLAKAKVHWQKFEKLWQELDDEGRASEQRDVEAARKMLGKALGCHV